MSVQITVRISPELDEQVSELAKRLGLRRSDLVRLALEALTTRFRDEASLSSYHKVQHLLGSVDSGIPDLGENHRAHLQRRFKPDA